MTSQAERAKRFAELHLKGDPLILFNVWDAGSALAVQQAGASALATGSWSVAAAQGYPDEENLPFDAAIANLQRIVELIELPVSLDFEGGYARQTEELQRNLDRVLKAGAVGINFEDQVIGGKGLYPVDVQCERIAALRQASDTQGVPLFINARTDIFLQAEPSTHSEGHLEQTIQRAHAYRGAGASGFFAPGLRDLTLIERLCQVCPLPVNILLTPKSPPAHLLARAGVARISHGPYPYRQMAAALTEAAQQAFSALDTYQI